jgi:S1-C subfamily serine protease
MAARALLLAAALVIALVALRAMLAPAPPLTSQDVERTIAEVLASATPSPPAAVAVYDQVRPSVVQVRARVPGAAGTASGSGVVLDTSGRILTSLHIVQNAVEVTLTFSDGSESPASIVAEAPETDIAVLQAARPPALVVPATLGDPRTVRIGDDAIVVGNPMGLARSLSTGSISGLDRSFQAPGRTQALDGLIQFDAAVNPGNSGGPLLNRAGDVVGIVTGLANPSGRDVFSGIGFAVPIDAAASAAGSPPY